MNAHDLLGSDDVPTIGNSGQNYYYDLTKEYYYNPNTGEFYDTDLHSGNGSSSSRGEFWTLTNGKTLYKNDGGKRVKASELPQNEAKVAQNKAMQYNAKEAKTARDGQEMMYSTRWQRTLKDIKKAGLNPYIMNMFSPGGFGTGGAASIYSNIAKQYAEAKTKSENKNINKKEATPFDGLSLVLPIMGAVIGSFANPALGAIGGALGGVGARGIRKHFKK